MNKPQAMLDAETILDEYRAMENHLKALKEVDPKIEQEIRASFKSFIGVMQRFQARSVYARQVLTGQYDDAAIGTTSDLGVKALADMIIGKTRMPEAVQRYLDRSF